MEVGSPLPHEDSLHKAKERFEKDSIWIQRHKAHRKSSGKILPEIVLPRFAVSTRKFTQDRHIQQIN